MVHQWKVSQFKPYVKVLSYDVCKPTLFGSNRVSFGKTLVFMYGKENIVNVINKFH